MATAPEESELAPCVEYQTGGLDFDIRHSAYFAGAPPPDNLLKDGMQLPVGGSVDAPGDLMNSLYGEEENEEDTMRFSLLEPHVQDKLNSADALIGSGNHPLTASQSERLQLYLGDLEEMLSHIRTLIQRYEGHDEEEMVGNLLKLNYSVLDAIARYDIIVACDTETPGQLGAVKAEAPEEVLDAPPLLEPDAPAKAEPAEQAPGDLDAPPAEQQGKKEIALDTVDGDCLVCWDEALLYKLPGCEHTYCYDCMEEYLGVKVMNGEVLEVTCPHPDCDTELQSSVIESFVTEEMFAKYQQFQFLSRLREEPNARFCPKCNEATIASEEEARSKHLVCNNCFMAFCFDCTKEWHEGKSCEAAEKERMKNLSRAERRAREKAEKDTKKYFRKQKTIECPSCGALVQKSSGCNHMECKCGCEFCWLCKERILVGGSYPMHYKVGACAGLQMSDRDELGIGRSVARVVVTPAKYGLIGVGVVAGGAAVVAGGAIVLGLAVPAAAVGLPIYGCYRLNKAVKRREREKRAAERRRVAEERRQEQRRQRLSASNISMAPAPVPDDDSLDHLIEQLRINEEVAAKSAALPFTCDMCTFDNVLGGMKCEICGAPRPTIQGAALPEEPSIALENLSSPSSSDESY